MFDLLSLPRNPLCDLSQVPIMYHALFEKDGDGLWVLTSTAADDFGRIAAGVEQLAEQRDSLRVSAAEAAKSAAVMSAVLLAGVQGVMAAAACALLESEMTITMTKGIPMAQTDGGEVLLREHIAEWVKAGDGQIFLPQHQTPKRDDYFARQLRRVNS